jgi:sigma-B regulation protein RsbU (phosphoserine phosphatase)
MAKLVSYNEDGTILAEYQLKRTVSIVGRIAEQDVFLQGNSVSRKHAEIHCSDDDFYLIDLSSLNGTFVNGERVSKSQLLEGDLVTFGKISLTFSLEPVTGINDCNNGSFLSRFVSSIQNATTKVDGHGGGGLYEFLSRKSEDTLRLEEDIVLAQQARNNKMEQAYRQLTILYKISEWLNLEIDPISVFGRCLELAVTTLKADRGIVLLHSEEDDSLEIHVAKLRVPDSTSLGDKSLVYSIARRVVDAGEPMAYGNDFCTDNSSVLTNATCKNAFIASPMQGHDGSSRGVLYFDNSDPSQSFGPLDLDFLATLGSQMAMTIDRAALIQEVVEKKEMECEMHIARDIQNRLLPKQLPTSRYFQVAGQSVAARHVGGDYFDFFPSFDKTGSRLDMIVLDVSGKGIPAALVVSQIRSALRIYSQLGLSCTDTVQRLNNLLIDDFDGSMYMTLVYAVFDFTKMTLSYVNAGHEWLALFRNGVDECLSLEASGKPCGLFEDEKYEEVTMPLYPGDRIVIHTDGLTDAERADGEKFGQERFDSLLVSVRDLSGEEAVKEVFAKLSEFTDRGGPQFDDMTLVVLDTTGYAP